MSKRAKLLLNLGRGRQEERCSRDESPAPDCREECPDWFMNMLDTTRKPLHSRGSIPSSLNLSGGQCNTKDKKRKIPKKNCDKITVKKQVSATTTAAETSLYPGMRTEDALLSAPPSKPSADKSTSVSSLSDQARNRAKTVVEEQECAKIRPTHNNNDPAVVTLSTLVPLFSPTSNQLPIDHSLSVASLTHDCDYVQSVVTAKITVEEQVSATTTAAESSLSPGVRTVDALVPLTPSKPSADQISSISSLSDQEINRAETVVEEQECAKIPPTDNNNGPAMVTSSTLVPLLSPTSSQLPIDQSTSVASLTHDCDYVQSVVTAKITVEEQVSATTTAAESSLSPGVRTVDALVSLTPSKPSADQITSISSLSDQERNRAETVVKEQECAKIRPTHNNNDPAVVTLSTLVPLFSPTSNQLPIDHGLSVASLTHDCDYVQSVVTAKITVEEQVSATTTAAESSLSPGVRTVDALVSPTPSKPSADQITSVSSLSDQPRNRARTVVEEKEFDLLISPSDAFNFPGGLVLDSLTSAAPSETIQDTPDGSSLQVCTSLPIIFANQLTPDGELPNNQDSGKDDRPTPKSACRRLFTADEVDNWPIYFADGTDTLEIEVPVFNAVELETENETAHFENILEDEPANETSTSGNIQDNVPEKDDINNTGKHRSRRDQARDPSCATRKRQRNASRWIANVRKEARLAGQSYTSAKGKEIPAKVLGPSCGTGCKYKCSQKVTAQDRQKILDTFNKESTTKGKWEMIARLVKSEPPKTSSDETKSGRNRGCAHQYFFIINKKSIRVCRTLFMNTLCISETTISTVFKKLDNSFKISPDKRGGHSQRPHKLPDCIRESVVRHINSFPRVASHYCRADTSFEYLEADVQSQAKMYRLYVEWCKVNNVDRPATERQYRDIFNHTPGLKINFFQPKKDICTVCFSYRQLSPEDQEKEKNKYQLHRDLKQIPQNLKREDRLRAEAKDNVDFCAAVFDLQKVLFTPKCNAGELYYKRKLSNYNFTVWDLGKHECFCYFWHEVIGQRGANEIGSFLMDFLTLKAAQGIKTFHLYADNCSGQNKNRMIFAMLMHVAAKFKVRIVLRILMTGHTQNEGDSAHATIETKSKNIEMFDPEDVYNLLQSAKQPNPNNPKSPVKPFVVKKVQQEDILDFHDFVNKHSVWTATTDGGKPAWKSLQEISFGWEEPWLIKYRCDLSSEQEVMVNTKIAKRGHPVNLMTNRFPRAYSDGPLHVSAAKLKDLISYCDGANPIIPQGKQDFYRNLKSSASARSDEFYT